jgi:hypothetical protein
LQRTRMYRLHMSDVDPMKSHWDLRGRVQSNQPSGVRPPLAMYGVAPTMHHVLHVLQVNHSPFNPCVSFCAVQHLASKPSHHQSLLPRHQSVCLDSSGQAAPLAAALAQLARTIQCLEPHVPSALC